MITGAVVFAGLVHGMLGLGFPMIATPLIAMVSDVLSAMLIVLVPTLTVNLISIAKGGKWRESIGRHWPLAVYCAVGSMVGTRLLLLTDPHPYKLVLAAVILFYLNIQRIGLRMEWVRQRPAAAYAFFGLCGGLLAGTVNVTVPALIVFALEARLKPTVTVQVFNFCFLAAKSTQAAVFTHAGVITGGIIAATAPFAAVTAVGLGIGMALRSRVDAERYRIWLRWILFLISLLLLLQFFGLI